MSSAAPAATPAAGPTTTGDRRKPRSGLTRRSGLQLLAGLLIVAGIPVVATVRILDANALRNQKAHADAALTAQLQAAGDEVRGLSDDASTQAADFSASPDLQQAMLKDNRAEIVRLARSQKGVIAVFVGGHRVVGRLPRLAVTRSTSLALNGRPVGRVVAAIPFDQRLLKRLLRATQHDHGDRLLFVLADKVVGPGTRIHLARQTVKLGGESYRAQLAPLPNAGPVKLLALRPSSAITASVRPYQERVLFAALGSFGLLVLVGLLFGGPILRTLGDFRRVASQAATDSLTGLANRWTFDEELALEWRRAERIGDPLGLILLDIDNFKSVNDTYGHQAGDEILRRVGQVLAESVRHADLAARYGGEEFGVVLPETDLDGAIELAERLRLALEAEAVELADGTRLSVTASFGAAVKGDLPGGEDLVAAADEALYEAKRTGKNRVAPTTAREPAAKALRQAERRRRPVSTSDE
jgi:diguanylate cyclase (GGDEF)-like protein